MSNHLLMSQKNTIFQYENCDFGKLSTVTDATGWKEKVVLLGKECRETFEYRCSNIRANYVLIICSVHCWNSWFWINAVGLRIFVIEVHKPAMWYLSHISLGCLDVILAVCNDLLSKQLLFVSGFRTFKRYWHWLG